MIQYTLDFILYELGYHSISVTRSDNVLKGPLKINFKRSRVEAERLVRRLLKSSSQEMMVPWPRLAVEEVRDGYIKDIF